MAKRQREWAKRVRLQMIEQLGGKCVDCGSIKDLELDHIEPCTWSERRPKMDASMRIVILRREMKEDKLAVRCSPCNTSKHDGNGSQPKMQEVLTNPF